MSDKTESKLLLSITEVTKKLGVSRRTVYNWIESGKVEILRVPSGCVRVVAESLLTDKAGKRLESGRVKKIFE